jgi:hypothetical protein
VNTGVAAIFLAARMKAETKIWAGVIQKANIKLQ